MGKRKKKETLGSYLCKVGYLDIYQQTKLSRPDVRGLRRAEGSSINIVHAKEVLERGFSTKSAAMERATQMVAAGIKRKKHGKD